MTQIDFVSGMALGAIWNAASFGCLLRSLHWWLGPRRSTPRIAAWMGAKISLLIAAGWGLLHSTTTIVLGFVAGFTLALILIVGVFARRWMRQAAHGH